MEDEEVEQKKSFWKDFYDGNKKLLWLLIIIVAFVLVAMMFTKRDTKEVEPPVEKVEVAISSETLELSKKTSSMLTMTVSNNKNAVIEWSSSNPSVASVSSTGLVKGVDLGEAIITGTYYNEKDGKKYKDQCLVRVYEGDMNTTITSLSFPDGDLMIGVGGTFDFTLNVFPSRGYIAKLEYQSDNPSVVSVDNDGHVKALKKGSATITVNVNKGTNYQSFGDTINVYVLDKNVNANIVNNPTSIVFKSKYTKMKIGDTSILEYDYAPGNANISELTWTSSDTNILSVSKTGMVKALKEGMAKVRVESLNGQYDEMMIEVIQNIIPVQKVSVDVTTINLKVGESYTIIPKVEPQDASNRALYFESTDDTIVSVKTNIAASQGIVLAHKVGTVTISIKTVDGNIGTTVLVNVLDNNNNQNNEENNNNGENNNEEKPKLSTSVNLTSDKNNIVYDYNQALTLKPGAPSKIIFHLGNGLSKVKYCLALASLSRCTPTEVAVDKTDLTILNNGVYRLRIIKYDLEGKEVVGTTSNYINGALECYVSTLADNQNNSTNNNTGNNTNNNTQRGYTISQNVYASLSEAQKNKYTTSQNITMKITGSNTKYLKICRKTGTACKATDTLTQWNANSILTIKGSGDWYLTIAEFDANNKELRRDLWYLSIK